MTRARLPISLPMLSSPLHAALHADHDQLTVGGQRVDVPVQVGRAHDVEDDVGARAVGLLADPRDEVLVAVVDRDLGAQFATEIAASPLSPR